MNLKNTITEKENILEGFRSRLNEAAERISNLEDRKVEFIINSQKEERTDTEVEEHGAFQIR